MRLGRRSLALGLPSLLAGRDALPQGMSQGTSQGISQGMSQGAGAYPSRPLTWVVPFTAAGVTDTTSRLVSRKLGQRLGQPIVVENRPGAGGTVGTEHVARAAPDGHTLLYGSNGAMAAAPSLFRRLGYDPRRSFIPIQALFESYNLLVANPDRPYRNLGELVAFARAHPGRINLAHAGVGTSTHLTAVLLEAVAGIELTHVAYTGAAAALTDLMAGNVDALFDFVVSSRDHVAAGRLRGLAITGRARLPAMPAVPSVAEAGFPDIVSSSWSGVFVPAGTPPAIVDRLAAEAAAVMRDPEVVAYGEGVGSRPATELHREALGRFVEAEARRWGDIIRRAGLQPS